MYKHVRSQSYSNCCIFTEVAISPLITCDLIKHLYLFSVSIFSGEGKKKDLQMAVSKYHYMHYYKHLSTFGYFFKSLPLIKFHVYAQLLLICLLIHVRRYFTLAYTPYLPLSAHPIPQLVTP